MSSLLSGDSEFYFIGKIWRGKKKHAEDIAPRQSLFLTVQYGNSKAK